MKKEEIAIELTKIYVEQNDISCNPFTLSKIEILDIYKYFLSVIEEKEDK